MTIGRVGIIATTFSDMAGLWRVCGPSVALRWMTHIARTAPTCLRQKRLAPADWSIGSGPFPLRGANQTLHVAGRHIMTGIRELWVREHYLAGGFLSLPEDAVVLDLGGNKGLFTLMALALAPRSRVVTVEASSDFCALLRDNLKRNALEHRCTLINAFVGGQTSYQQDAKQTEAFAGAPMIDIHRLLEDNALTHIDLLKCDIEGSEFELLTRGSELLKRTRQITAEIHDFAGDRVQLLEGLRRDGFEVRVVKDDPGCCTIQAKRPAVQR